MELADFEEFHSELDNRVIGYSAHGSHFVTFDRAILFGASVETLLASITAMGVTHPVEFEPENYESLMHSMDEDGTIWHLDPTATVRFRRAMSEDLRHVRNVLMWDSDMGTMIEPEYNLFVDSTTVLEA